MNKKLSQLQEKITSLNADDLLYVSTNGVSKSIKASVVEAPLKAYADQKKSELLSEISELEADLSDEIAARISADMSNLTLANSYTDQKKSEVLVLIDDVETTLASETASRISGDTSTLTTAKAYTDTKHTEASLAIDEVESGLTQEIADRVAGDAATLTSANSYANLKKTEVLASLSSEIERASAAESALSSRIDNVLSNIDPVALDSLTEVVSAFQNADSNLNSAISSLATEIEAELSQEVENRISADNALDARLDILEADPVTKTYVDSEVSQEVSDRQAAISSVQVQIDELTTADIAEDSNLYYTDIRVQQKLANITGHIIPVDDEMYDLGTPTKKFRELHLSGNTIYLGGFTLSSSPTEGFVVTDPNNESAIVSDGIREGVTNLFFNEQRVQETELSMLDVTKSGDIVSTDSVVDAVSKLQNSISLEVSTRISQDSDLDSKIDTEIADRITQGETLDSKIDIEISTRSSQDSILDEKINTEITNRIAADGATLASAKGYTDSSVDAVRIPVGTMHIFAGTVAPAGYLICNGSAISRVEFADLYAVVGISFGAGNGVSTFNLPNPDTNVNLRYIIKI